jgi:bile acid:Na+ symporter, BASS family
LVRNVIASLMVLTIVLVFIVSWNIVVENAADLALAGLMFCAVLVATVYFYTAAFGLDPTTRFTIVVEVVIQNVVLTALVATSILQRPELAIFAAAYAPAIALAMLVWVLIRKRSVERGKTASVEQLRGV